MFRKLSLFGVLFFSLILIGAGCSSSDNNINTSTPPANQDQDDKQSYSLEESKQIATDWIKQESPTYKFDGSKLKFVSSTETGGSDCSDCYQLTFEFESAHGGYGDREEKMVTQVITSHKMRVTVEHGNVTKAITDGKFDEMAGKMIKQDPKEDPDNTTNSTSTVNKSNANIKLTNVSDGDTISRTTTIKGEAKGPWYFEGSFSLIVKDPSGNQIDGMPAQAQGNWMQSGFVPFKAELDLSNYSGSQVILEFQKANPSGMAQHADSYSIQVNLN